MTSCYHRHRMPWSGVTGAIARCKNKSTACARKSRSVPVLRWICGVKLKPKAVNKPSHHCIMHGLDKPGVFTTVSNCQVGVFAAYASRQGYALVDKRLFLPEQWLSD